VNFKSLFAALLGFCIVLPAAGKQERSCDDEQQQAATWIQWAAERRAACRANSFNKAEELACLERARAQLAEAEKDHASVYSGQIRALDPGHPVVRGLMAKLKDNVQAAEALITSETEAQQITAIRKQNCMNRR
jgi:hypothetical protein